MDKKYGWQICDEVERCVSNAAEIEFVKYSAYRKIEAERDALKAELERANRKANLKLKALKELSEMSGFSEIMRLHARAALAEGE